jgi:hypothetical protein
MEGGFRVPCILRWPGKVPADTVQNGLFADVAQTRWLLVEQTYASISKPLLIVVIAWLAIIFGSVGLFAPSNSTVVASLMLAALSVSGAIFLILELDQPFGGLIQISSEPMRHVLSHLK